MHSSVLDVVVDLLGYLFLVGLFAVLSSVYLSALRLVHWVMYRKRSTGLGLLAKMLYMMPAMSIVWLGLTFSRVTHLVGIDLNALEWLGLVATTGLLGLSCLRRRLGITGRTLTWVRSWPGWRGAPYAEPRADHSSDLMTAISFPALTLLLSVTDLVGKTANVFSLVPSTAMTFSAFLTVVGCLAFSSVVLTKTRNEDTQFGCREVLAYPKRVRITTIVGAVLSLRHGVSLQRMNLRATFTSHLSLSRQTHPQELPR